VVLVAGAVLLGAGVALLTPAIFAAIFGRVEPTRRGAAAATASIFIDLGLSVGPIALGVVIRQFGFLVGFGACAVIALVGALIVLWPAWASVKKPQH
jgi:MFS family permease